MGQRWRIWSLAYMARRISMGARRELVAAVAERYRQSGRVERGRILDELTAVTGWHRKHAIRALAGSTFEPRSRCGPRRLYTEPVRDALSPCGRHPTGYAANG
jgi:hypothetical protein